MTTQARVRVAIEGAPTARAALQALRAALRAVEDGSAPSGAWLFDVDVSERPALTAKQSDILTAIIEYRKEHGSYPTIRELCRIVGIKSTNNMHEHLGRMSKKGYVTMGDRVHRGIVLID